MSDFFDKDGKQKSWLNIAHYGIRLSHIFETPSISNEIPSILNEKPSISTRIPSISIQNLGFRSKY